MELFYVGILAAVVLGVAGYLVWGRISSASSKDGASKARKEQSNEHLK